MNYPLLPRDIWADALAAAPPPQRHSEARNALYERFASRIQVGEHLNRKLVSYQGNKRAPGLRWLKYKEGYSAGLVRGLLQQASAVNVLDPFSGTGTTALTAAGMGIPGTGIEIMPIGNLAARAIAAASIGIDSGQLSKVSIEMAEAISKKDYSERFVFPHIQITDRAFPQETERDLAKAREFVAGVEEQSLSLILTLACVSVLEEVSYTRKDGQFLRWDPQSGRDVSRKLHKSSIPTLSEALHRRLTEIATDIPSLKRMYSGPAPEFIEGSSLTELRSLPSESFDTVITSPPYANRYDYTRTYALELAYLGLDQDQFKMLRQSLLSATVENRSKRQSLAREYEGNGLFLKAMAMVDSHSALQEALNALKASVRQLSNRNVISLIENYFTEMALIVSELEALGHPGRQRIHGE